MARGDGLGRGGRGGGGRRGGGRRHGGVRHRGRHRRNWYGGGYPYYGYPYYDYYDSGYDNSPQVVVLDRGRDQPHNGINWPTIAVSVLLSAVLLLRK